MTIAKDAKVTGKNVEEKTKMFSIRFLLVVKKLQLIHGLRHGDYQRYRSYCTRRIQRLRRSLHLPQGDKRHFRKRPITDSHLDNEKAVHVPLMLAERAWSYAMQLRIEGNTEPRKRFHVVSRLRKAVAHALHLQQLCENERFDACTKLEAEAYVGWVRGTLYFELKSWPLAIENLKRAQMIYEKLSQSLDDSDDNVKLYSQRINELTPSIRYCAYNIGDDTAIEELLQLRAQAHGDLLNNIDIVMKQSSKDSSISLTEIHWLNKPLVVKSEKVRIFLISDRDLGKTFKQNTVSQNIELLEQHLMDCKDAISEVQDEINAEPPRKIRPNVISQLQHLLSYITYVKITRTIERNVYLADSAKKTLLNPLEKYKQIKTAGSATSTGEDQKSNPHYIARLYELNLQHLSELEQLVGEENDVLQQSFQTKKSAYNSFRCYYIGLQLVSLQHWNMAAAVFNEAARYADELLDVESTPAEIVDEMKQLKLSINYAKYTICALNVLASGDQNDGAISKEKSVKQKILLYEKLDVYHEDPNALIDPMNAGPLCPNLQPIPYKPLFFDLVHDKFRMPSLKEKVQDKKSSVSAGLTGFVKGIWGWGGSKQ